MGGRFVYLLVLGVATTMVLEVRPADAAPEVVSPAPVWMETWETHPLGAPPTHSSTWTAPRIQQGRCAPMSHSATVVGDSTNKLLLMRVTNPTYTSGATLYRTDSDVVRLFPDSELTMEVRGLQGIGGSGARAIQMGLDLRASAAHAWGYRVVVSHYAYGGDTGSVSLLRIGPIPAEACVDPAASHIHKVVKRVPVPGTNPFAGPVDFTLGLRAVGASLTVLHDGAPIATVTDSSAISGDVGLYLHAGDGRGAFEARAFVDNVRLSPVMAAPAG